jgi:hypothetical protein
VFVPAGSGWMQIFFPINPGDLVAEVGTAAAALNADTLRIFHNPQATFPSLPIGIPAVNAVLAVDNIRASVPEPQTISLLAVGLLSFLTLGRRSGRVR